MSSIEKKLYREAVIKEFKEKYYAQQDKIPLSSKIMHKLKQLIPFNIGVGIIASLIYIYISSWVEFAKLLLMGVIWITVITGIVSLFINKT
tara:strand:- start:76 stop:348 length:273 start_codon:yes stop_codon:yes gene_type:complete